jgi:hypothetical protein
VSSACRPNTSVYHDAKRSVHGAVNVDPHADLAVYFLPDDYPCRDERFWPAARIDRSLEQLPTDHLFRLSLCRAA